MFIYKIDFNISYSLLQTYKQSPLQFYFQKILKLPETRPRGAMWGDAGKVLHEELDRIIKKQSITTFNKKLCELEKEGIKKSDYEKCLVRGIDYVCKFESEYELQSEEKIEFFIDGIRVKGIIDVILKKGNEVILIDWKTNGSVPEDGFIEQQKFYSYLYYKKYGILPNYCKWLMLKTNDELKNTFTLEQILSVEKQIIDFIEYVKTAGTDISKYPEGDYDNIFNPYLEQCLKEVEKRSKGQIIECLIKNNRIFFEIKDKKLIKALDLKFSYFVDGAEFSDLFKRHLWDGKAHLLLKNSLPLGLKKSFEKLVDEYNTRFDTNYILFFKDLRQKNNTVFEPNFKTPKIDLRYYQKEAVLTALKEKHGILYLGTSAGKTAIAAELCKKLNTKTLIVINRIELVEQLGDQISDYLGIEVGKMMKGRLDIDKQICVASVQTIASLIEDKEVDWLLKPYLLGINCLIFDECQTIKDAGMYKIFSKYCSNANYIYGLSGTPFRNDCHTMKMNALVGEVIYSKTTAELEKEGFITPTKTYFIGHKHINIPEGQYSDVYDMCITQNSERNTIIYELVKKYKNKKKILVLTKIIKHGEVLAQNIENSLLINSKVDYEQRKDDFEKFKTGSGFVLVGSAQIFSTGIDIPDLDIIINVSGNKSDVQTIQSIGRVKRASPGKQFGYFIDFFDSGADYFYEASKKRIEILEEFGNKVSLVYKWKELELA